VTTEQLAALKEVAEKASTQQRWKLYNDGSICANVNGGQHSIAKITFPKLKGSMEDARHIAAFDPTTCLQLLEEVERLTDELAQSEKEKADQVERFNLEWAKRREAEQMLREKI
jgi:hypothetical protein